MQFRLCRTGGPKCEATVDRLLSRYHLDPSVILYSKLAGEVGELREIGLESKANPFASRDLCGQVLGNSLQNAVRSDELTPLTRYSVIVLYEEWSAVEELRSSVQQLRHVPDRNAHILDSKALRIRSE